ncbi:MAG TPA: alpha/beta hydrolase [Methylomirabilota bacterium]|nr:alpha/beta hydrolase [Methylomirabilota bacterium]
MTRARPAVEPWQHRSIEANGLRFHAVTQEPASPVESRPGAAPLVLLLHGFPEFWYCWRHQIPALAAAGFSVVAPDLRGYNESDKPEDIDAYRITNMVEDVAGMIRSLGRERAVIVGHDWGGAVAYAFAMLKPEMTSRLCVMNSPHPALFAREFQRGNVRQLRRSWYMFFFQFPEVPERVLAADNFRVLKAMLVGSARKGTFRPADLARYVEAFAKPGALTGAINWYRASFRRGLPSVREFPKIAAPTLIIWGDRDFALGTELTRGMRPFFSGPFALRYLRGVSHWVQHEAPGKVNALLIRFLTRPRRPEP